ncbi:MAG: ribose 5-phosphate isomerase B [Melioribacteraceae bacterium]|nr:MAG: ribose 5-phosphate isomerase B [Melioribacteraceae bacterium]
MDRIKSSKIQIVKKKKDENEKEDILPDNNRIAIGGDHTGYEIKEVLKKFLKDKNFDVIDVGTNSKESCDYPDFAIAVAKKVAIKEARFGILIDATGIPSAITANKFPGIRAATCYNEFSAKSAREHNNANIIVLGAKTLGEETIKSILDTWLKTGFAGERHQKRLNKISDVEKYFMKF